MAKLSLDEFKNKYNEKIVDNDDLLIELMEDATDSFSSDEAIKNLEAEIATKEAEIAEKEAEIDDLKRRYKERFLTSNEEATEEKEEELKEENILDIREI